MTTVSMGELQAELPSYVNKVHDDHDEVFVTDGGIPKAVLVDADEYLATQATMDLLGSPGLLDQVDRGLDDPREFSFEELLEAVESGVVPEPYDPHAAAASARHQGGFDPFAETHVPTALVDSGSKQNPLVAVDVRQITRHQDLLSTHVYQQIEGRRFDVDALVDLTGRADADQLTAYLVDLRHRARVSEVAIVQQRSRLAAISENFETALSQISRAQMVAAVAALARTSTPLAMHALAVDSFSRHWIRQRLSPASHTLMNELLEYIELRRPSILEHLRNLGIEQRVAVYEIIIDGLASLVDVETFADATLLQPSLVTPKTDDEPKLVVVRKAA